MCLGLAGRFNAIVATDAVARDVYVIEVGRNPPACPVTVVAGVAAGDMRRVLAGCADTVMTSHAVADNATMVEHGG